MTLSDTDIERWSRQILLPDVGGRGQLRLLAARVAVAGSGAVEAHGAELLRRAGLSLVAAATAPDADVLLDLGAGPVTADELARRAVASGTPLVRARLSGAAGTVDTLVGRPCGCCVTADPTAAADGGPLTAPAVQALAALAAAEVVAAVLLAPRQGRRQRFDLVTGEFAGTALAASACDVCGARA